MEYNWYNQHSGDPQSYTCSYCGKAVASEKGYLAEFVLNGRRMQRLTIYICHFCTKPTFFDFNEGTQWPGVQYGNTVEDIDDAIVEALYDEARRCTGSGSYTAAVMCCRKLLMHIAVSKGAKENQKFVEYVDYLADENFIPPGAKAWVSHIKNKGNEANHEIKLMQKEDAEELISFMEMLLKLIYEFPARIKPSATQEV